MKISIPDVVDQFRAYYRKPGNGGWGSLHIVLDDGNVRDDDVLFCWNWAAERGDADGARLASILMQMSKTQRRKLPAAVERIVT